jgi:transglutaminase-like putative cysteine protease
MFYTVRHVTRFTYETPITESVMEARMEPRSEGTQRCMHFSLTTTPASRVTRHRDHEGNIVHHFDIPGRHSQLIVTADALVDCTPVPDVPLWLDRDSWDRLDAMTAAGECWDVLNPSTFARPTECLNQFAQEIELVRGPDPLGTLRRLMGEMSARFDYSPHSTRVDSPIDDALQARHGVCQDFAHIFIALARQLGVPCRYVSGYLLRGGSSDRSADEATHAWAEAFLPDIGWTGFDPTNNLVVGDRHIRVAIGRDYADVPPTRGIYKGVSAVKSELAVAVRVGPATRATSGEALSFVPWVTRDAFSPPSNEEPSQSQQ